MTKSRRIRLMKIRGTTARVEAMLLRLKNLSDDDFYSQDLRHIFGDLYFLARLARKAP